MHLIGVAEHLGVRPPGVPATLGLNVQMDGLSKNLDTWQVPQKARWSLCLCTGPLEPLHRDLITVAHQPCPLRRRKSAPLCVANAFLRHHTRPPTGKRRIRTGPWPRPTRTNARAKCPESRSQAQAPTRSLRLHSGQPHHENEHDKKQNTVRSQST